MARIFEGGLDVALIANSDKDFNTSWNAIITIEFCLQNKLNIHEIENLASQVNIELLHNKLVDHVAYAFLIQMINSIESKINKNKSFLNLLTKQTLSRKTVKTINSFCTKFNNYSKSLDK